MADWRIHGGFSVQVNYGQKHVKDHEFNNPRRPHDVVNQSGSHAKC